MFHESPDNEPVVQFLVHTFKAGEQHFVSVTIQNYLNEAQASKYEFPLPHLYQKLFLEKNIVTNVCFWKINIITLVFSLF